MAPPSACPQCGARIDAPQQQQAYVYTCRFCQAKVPIEGLAPPPAPAPREVRIVVQAPGAAAFAVRKAGTAVGCIIAFSVIVPVGITLVAVLWPLFGGSITARFSSFPIQVPLNGEVEIADRTATATDTPITVGINGKLTLRRCRIKAPLIVKAGVNAEITIVDSALEGQKGIVEAESNLVLHIQNSTITSGEEIVDSTVNAKVDVTKDSKLKAEGVAFPLDNNGEVTIDHSSVEGKLGGVALKNNGHLKMTGGAVLTSDGPAVDLSFNGHLALTSSRVESKTEAIRAGNNVEGTLRATTLTGPRAALEVGSNGHLTLAQTTLAGPKKVGPLTTLDER